MRRAPLCRYHQSVFDRGLGRAPYTHMTKTERRARAWVIHRQCLACQGLTRPERHVSRELEDE